MVRFFRGSWWLVLVACLGVAAGCTPDGGLGVSDAGKVKVDTFNLIKNGMSIEEVEKIVPGGLQSWEPGWDTLVYLAYDVGGAEWIVAFQDGKVIDKGNRQSVKDRVKEAVAAGTGDPGDRDEGE